MCKMFLLSILYGLAVAELSGLYYGSKSIVFSGRITMIVNVSTDFGDVFITYKNETYSCANEPYTLSSTNESTITNITQEGNCSTNEITITNVTQEGNCVKDALDSANATLSCISYDPEDDEIHVNLTDNITITVTLEKVPESEPTPNPTLYRRPEPTPSTEAPTCDDTIPVAQGGCDPHFQLFNNKHISYHGECDLVLLSCPDFASPDSLDIQIRTKIKKSYSYIQRIAMKFGDDYFEMAGKHDYYVNNKFHQEPPAEFAGYYVQQVEQAPWCRDKCSNAVIFKFYFGTYGSVELANWAGFLHVKVSGPGFDNCTGLLGQRSKLGMVARNGTVMEKVNHYGQEWQVSDLEINLFRNERYPQYPDPCILPKQDSRRRIDLSTHLMAIEACSHLSGTIGDMCIFDVVATGDALLAYAPMFG